MSEEHLPYLGRIKANLACQKPSTERVGNLNEHITDPLDELAAGEGGDRSSITHTTCSASTGLSQASRHHLN